MSALEPRGGSEISSSRHSSMSAWCFPDIIEMKPTDAQIFLCVASWEKIYNVLVFAPKFEYFFKFSLDTTYKELKLTTLNFKSCKEFEYFHWKIDCWSVQLCMVDRWQRKSFPPITLWDFLAWRRFDTTNHGMTAWHWLVRFIATLLTYFKI